MEKRIGARYSGEAKYNATFKTIHKGAGSGRSTWSIEEHSRDRSSANGLHINSQQQRNNCRRLHSERKGQGQSHTQSCSHTGHCPKKGTNSYPEEDSQYILEGEEVIL